MLTGPPQSEPYTPFPLFGHLHAFAGRPRQDVLEWLLAASRHFKGRSWRLEVPMAAKGWFVNDPAALKHVLSTKHSSFGKGGFFERRARDLFGIIPPNSAHTKADECPGNGILIATGDSWRAQRAAGHTMVNPPTLRRFAVDALPRNVPVLLGPLEIAARNDGSIDFEEFAMEYSLAVFGEIAFDADWERMSTSFSRPFMNSSAGVSDRFGMPFYRLVEWVLPYGRRLRADLDRVHRFSRELLREALDEIREEELGKKEVKEGKGLLVRALMASGVGMSVEEMADSCLNFLTAGRDTTGQAITWTLYLLLRHPSYFPRIYAEIDSLPPDTSNSDLASHLPLLEATISESLRLHPPIPIEILENISSSPVILPDSNGCVVAPGDQVVWSAWVMARLPSFWGPDAEQFRPERWSEIPRRPTAYEWPVFHAGPRSCLGQPLARLELTYALVEVFRRYELEMAWGGGERGVMKGLTAAMVGGLPVRVTRRRW